MKETVAAAELDYVIIDTPLIQRGVESLAHAKRAGLRVVTAESCTGGLIALVLSEAPGAAEHLEGGFVVYTPTQKCAALKIDPVLLDKHGAVSAEVAKAMALGALANSDADIALSVTGVAGPDPDERGLFILRARVEMDLARTSSINSAISAARAFDMKQRAEGFR